MGELTFTVAVMAKADLARFQAEVDALT